MNGKDLLTGLGYIDTRYYEEADTAQMAETAKTKFLSRPMVIAALIGLMVLLMGCAWVVMNLDELRLGEHSYTAPKYIDEEGNKIPETEKIMDVISLQGVAGSPEQMAAKEWFDFEQSYDTDRKLMNEADENPIEISRDYDAYFVYTQEMVDKVDEIAEKYNLKLLDTRIPFQQYQSDIFLKETGINSLLRSGVDAETQHMVGMLYPPYNFSMEFALAAEDVGGGLWASYTYTRKDYFPRDYYGGSIDLSLFEQWDYTVPDGTQVLLALSNKGQGYIIAEQENAMIIISIDGNRSNSAYPDASEVITKEELEDISDFNTTFNCQ